MARQAFARKLLPGPPHRGIHRRADHVERPATLLAKAIVIGIGGLTGRTRFHRRDNPENNP
jgi:hypothetical protein